MPSKVVGGNSEELIRGKGADVKVDLELKLVGEDGGPIRRFTGCGSGKATLAFDCLESRGLQIVLKDRSLGWRSLEVVLLCTSIGNQVEWMEGRSGRTILSGKVKAKDNKTLVGVENNSEAKVKVELAKCLSENGDKTTAICDLKLTDTSGRKS